MKHAAVHAIDNDFEISCGPILDILYHGNYAGKLVAEQIPHLSLSPKKNARYLCLLRP